jgi:DNA repair exonuclease SbcCD nuclease subunit
MRISHITDIHIRPLSRHQEYRSVFNELLEKLREENPDFIFLTGDLFHTKCTNISGEYINLCNWFLTSLSIIAPAIVVLGNHDGNIVNLDREDAVSPIVKALNNPRILLFKNSGVFEIGPGVNLCHYSIFDKAGWPQVAPVEGDINIAVYHGPVNGSLTDDDWELTGELSVSDFIGYDAVLLGDIHRMQFLDFREYEMEIDESELSKYPDAKLIY